MRNVEAAVTNNGREQPTRPTAEGGDANSAVATISLSELRAGVCAKVVTIDAADDDLHRLMAMGVCVGRNVELVQNGDPMILRVLGCRIGVSARLARRVRVESCLKPECQPHPPENPPEKVS